MAVIDEQRVIGCLLVNSASLGQCGNLTAEMFRDPTLKLLFSTIEGLIRNCKKVSQQSIINSCDGKLSAEYLDKCLPEFISNIAMSTEITAYAEAIIGDYNKLVIKELAKEMNSKTLTRVNFADYKQNLIRRLSELPDSLSTDDPSLETLVRECQPQRYVKNDRKFLNFGIKNLDSFTGGLEGGDVAVIAARPAVGKSAFAFQLIVSCCRQGLKVGLFNEELTRNQVYDRLVAHVGGLDLNHIRHATMFQEGEEEKFRKANAELLTFKMDVHCGKHSAEEVKSICELNNYDVVFIDYVQLLKTRLKGKQRNEEVGEVSKIVKGIAMTRNIPIIILSQLNRNTSEDKEPNITDLRESGDLEQDASVVIMLWNKDGKKEKKGYKVAKSRNGETGNGLFEFQGAMMTFIEINTKREQTVLHDDGFVVADPDDSPFFANI